MEFSITSLVLDGIAVLIVVISLITGIKRGFFRSLALLIAVVAAIFVSMTFSDRFADWINEKFVSENVNEKISGMLGKLLPDESGAPVTASEETLPAEDEGPAPESEQGENKDFLDSLKSGTFSSLLDRLGSSMEAVLAEIKDKAGSALHSAADALSKPISTSISKGAAVIILFVGTLILALIIIKLFDVIFSTKPLSGINRLLGGIVGLIKGVLIAFIFCYAACRLVPSLSGLSESIPTDIIEKTFIVRRIGLM